MNTKQRYGLIFGVFVLLSIVLLTQPLFASDVCTNADKSGCWSRYYGAGTNPDGDPGRVFYRLIRACKDGIQVGIANDAVNTATVYATQWNAALMPPIRKLIENTNVMLTSIPGGEVINSLAEGGAGTVFTATIYYKKIVNMGYLRNPLASYGTSAFLEDNAYGNPIGIGLGIAKTIENCYLFPSVKVAGTRHNSLVPTIVCKFNTFGQSIKVRFGYQNYTGYEAIIPAGPYNQFATDGMFDLSKFNHPRVFPMGSSNNIATREASGHYISWKLGNTTRSTAGLALPLCKG